MMQTAPCMEEQMLAGIKPVPISNDKNAIMYATEKWGSVKLVVI